MNNRIMLGVQGVDNYGQMEQIIQALKGQKGVSAVEMQQLGEIAVEYDPQRLTVMDLIRVVREEGFLAGML